MTDQREHLENEPEPRVTDEFAADLTSLFTTNEPIPPEVDQAIFDRATAHFAARKHRRFPALRWVAAAAAVIFLAIMSSPWNSRPAMQSASLVQVAKADVDHNGRIDILDAFTLARHVGRAEKTGNQWDFNDDGFVNRKDVDIVAFAAVRLDKGV